MSHTHTRMCTLLKCIYHAFFIYACIFIPHIYKFKYARAQHTFFIIHVQCDFIYSLLLIKLFFHIYFFFCFHFSYPKLGCAWQFVLDTRVILGARAMARNKYSNCVCDAMASWTKLYPFYLQSQKGKFK